MSVRPYRDKKTKEIVPNKFEIDVYVQGTGERVQQVISLVTRAQVEVIAARIRRGTRQALPTDPTVLDVYPDWLTDYARDNSPRTVKDIEWAFVRLLPHFGHLQITGLQPEHFRAYMDKRIKDTWRPPNSSITPKPISKRQINKELTYLSGCIKWGIKELKLPEMPFSVPKFKKVKPAPKILPSLSEVDLLLENLNPVHRLAVLLYHDAGLRLTEAMTLQEENIFLSEDFMNVLGKGAKWRTVPIITDRLKDGLRRRIEELQEEKRKAINPISGKEYRRGGNLSVNYDGYLFWNPKTGTHFKDFRKAVESAADSAHISKRIYNHLFRHAHITNSLEAGIDLETTRENVGHEDIKTTQMYLHQKKLRRIQETRKLAEFLESAKNAASTGTSEQVAGKSRAKTKS